MSLESRILNAETKELAYTTAELIGDDQQSFKTLVELFLSADYRQCQRASWILGHGFHGFIKGDFSNASMVRQQWFEHIFRF